MLEYRLPRNEWTLEAAAHLLSRAAFGGSPSDVQKLFHMGHEQAVDFLLTNNEKDSLDQLDVKETFLKPLMNQNLKPFMVYHITFNRLKTQWFATMANNTFSFKDKLALFWHSNIPIGLTHNSNVISLKKYLDVLRTDGQKEFEVLISSISKQYEMAHYLNLATNKANRINENFARELLELFTLGEGNYSEHDIKEIARVFTGFAFNENFDLTINEQHVDKTPKTIFRRTKNFTPNEVITLIVRKKECSEHIATKLWKFYVSEKIDKKITEELGFSYRKTQMNTSKFLKVIFLSKAFYSKDFMSTQIKSPVQLIIQGAKQLGIEYSKIDWSVLLNNMNQNLFDPPNVKGWQGGQEWITSDTLISRYETANKLTGSLSAENLHSLVPEGLSPNAICDLISARLFYAPPSEKLKRNMVAFMEKTDYSSIEVKRELLKIAMSTPQYQLT